MGNRPPKSGVSYDERSDTATINSLPPGVTPAAGIAEVACRVVLRRRLRERTDALRLLDATAQVRGLFKYIFKHEQMLMAVTESVEGGPSMRHVLERTAHLSLTKYYTGDGRTDSAATDTSPIPWPASHAMMVIAASRARGYKRRGAVKRRKGDLPDAIFTELNGDMRKLGEGAFGCVILVNNMAVKVQLPDEDPDREGIVDEAAISQLVHNVVSREMRATPYTIELLWAHTATWESEGKPRNVEAFLTIVGENCGDGGVKDRIADTKEVWLLAFPALAGNMSGMKDIQEDDKVAWTFQLLQGLAAMNKTLGVVHRDIKPENVLIRRSTEPRKAVCLIRGGESGRGMTFVDTHPSEAIHADFGLSRASGVPSLGPAMDPVNPRESLNQYRQHDNGTADFFDPMFVALLTYSDTEEKVARRYSGFYARGIATDVWAIGITLFDLWSNNTLKSSKGYKGQWEPALNAVLAGAPGAKGQRELGFEASYFASPADKSRTFSSSFVMGLLLHAAMHEGAFPTFPTSTRAKPGPYWAYFARNFAALLVASRAGRPSGKNLAEDAWDLITSQDARDVLMKCLDFDPEKRARYLMEGHVFEANLFAPLRLVSENQDHVPKETYMLDLAASSVA